MCTGVEGTAKSKSACEDDRLVTHAWAHTHAQCSLVAAARILCRITCAQHLTRAWNRDKVPTNTEAAFCLLCLLFWSFFGQLLWECVPASPELLISIPQDLFQASLPCEDFLNSLSRDNLNLQRSLLNGYLYTCFILS